MDLRAGDQPDRLRHPPVVLNPGASVDLKIGFKPGPMWPARLIRNCAEYDYAASGRPVFGDTSNDRACAIIPICRRGDPDCRPPVDKKVDLTIIKRAAHAACSLDGVCAGRLYRQFGHRTFNGPLTMVDNYPTGAPTSSAFGPPPPWSCGPAGPGQYRCDIAGIVLVPGASTQISLQTTIPPDYPADKITNCAKVEPVPDESNLTNNQACADQRVPRQNPGEPALRITKSCDAAVAGAAVSCRITMISLGTTAPSGPVRVNDAATILGAATPSRSSRHPRRPGMELLRLRPTRCRAGSPAPYWPLEPAGIST